MSKRSTISFGHLLIGSFKMAGNTFQKYLNQIYPSELSEKRGNGGAGDYVHAPFSSHYLKNYELKSLWL